MKIELNQKISSHLAFLFVLVFGFGIAIYLINIGQKIIDDAKESPNFSIDERIEQQIPDKK